MRERRARQLDSPAPVPKNEGRGHPQLDKARYEISAARRSFWTTAIVGALQGSALVNALSLEVREVLFPQSLRIQGECGLLPQTCDTRRMPRR